MCCSPWGCKESDMTEQLNWTEIYLGKVDFLTILSLPTHEHDCYCSVTKWHLTPCNPLDLQHTRLLCPISWTQYISLFISLIMQLLVQSTESNLVVGFKNQKYTCPLTYISTFDCLSYRSTFTNAAWYVFSVIHCSIDCNSKRLGKSKYPSSRALNNCTSRKGTSVKS